MNHKWWYRAQASPLLRRMSLVGIIALGIIHAAFPQVDAQDPSRKPSAGADIPANFPLTTFDVVPKTSISSAEGAIATKATVKKSSTDSTPVWVDSQVVWEEIRNLFVPQATMQLKRQQQVSSQVDSITRFPTITGIISSKEGGNRAILDGMVVRPGDRLKDFLVKQITSDRVTLQGEETYALVLKPHQTPAIKIFMIPAFGKGNQEIVVNLAPEKAAQSEGKGEKPNVEP